MNEGWKMTERPDVVPRRKWPSGLSVSASRRVLRIVAGFRYRCLLERMVVSMPSRGTGVQKLSGVSANG